MNTVKNLLIIAVLAGAGYAVYVSLQRNSESPQGAGAPQIALPSMKVELPNGNSNASTALPLGGRSALPSGSAGLGVANAASPMPSTPLVSIPNAAIGTPANMQAAPFQSSLARSVPSSIPPQPATASMTAPPTNVLSTGNVPGRSPTAAQTKPGDMVQNLGPPPDMFGSAVPPPASPNIDANFQDKLNKFMTRVQKELAAGKLADAHLALSSLYCSLYGQSDLPPEQAEQINDLLGKLAGTVIYSQQSCLEKPYVVQPGDTLDRVAKQYGMSWQFLGKVNNLLPPKGFCDDNDKDRPLPTGMSLKVVRGPFDALINLSRHELTLLLRDPSGLDRYAGRFMVGVGHDQPNLEGDYVVHDMTVNPRYYSPDGMNVEAGDPRNPLGSAWIGLTDRIGIHGTNNPQTIGHDGNPGSICVGEGDIQDLCSLLSVGSRVKIVR